MADLTWPLTLHQRLAAAGSGSEERGRNLLTGRLVSQPLDTAQGWLFFFASACVVVC